MTADGLLYVDKPTGPTSHDVVARIRRLTGQRRVGHSGTLDPPASGLLLIAIGRATRLIRFLPQQPKVYSGILRLGESTSTDDATGDSLCRHFGPLPSADAVLAAAATLEGALLQRPPAVSARKVDGQRLYKLARQGRTVVVPPRPVQVDFFELRHLQSGDYSYRTSVSSGTYVRSLARDLGILLGCHGHIRSLRRDSIGPIDVGLSIDVMDEIEPDSVRTSLVPLDRIPLVPPSCTLQGEHEDRLFFSGVALSIDRFRCFDAAPQALPGVGAESDVPPQYHRVLTSNGRLAGVAEASRGQLKPIVVLSD